MDKQEEHLNKDNEWLRFLRTGESNDPYLKGKIKPKPKVQYTSAKQRRIFNN
jgi:hypothetical protein